VGNDFAHVGNDFAYVGNDFAYVGNDFAHVQAERRYFVFSLMKVSNTPSGIDPWLRIHS
jgi:hypothetical protein